MKKTLLVTTLIAMMGVSAALAECGGAGCSAKADACGKCDEAKSSEKCCKPKDACSSKKDACPSKKGACPSEAGTTCKSK